MDSAARMRQRADKLREQLECLKKEVNVANVVLQQVLDKSVALVQQLEAAKSNQVYLREYTKVQKFLLKYVNFITEFNCNLEILSDDDDVVSIQLDESSEKEDVDNGKVDPRTEFKEKVKKLVTEEVKTSKVLDPKSWTEAPPFVPKIAPEVSNGVIVPKVSSPMFTQQIRPLAVAPPPPPSINPYQFQVFYNVASPPPGMGVQMQMQRVPLWKTQQPQPVTRRPIKIEPPMNFQPKVMIKELDAVEIKKMEKVEEAPKEEPKKPEAPREDWRKPEAPREEAKKPEVPREDWRKPEALREEPKKPEVPREEPKKPEVSREEPIKPEVPREEPKKPEVPREEPKKPAEEPEVPKEEPKEEDAIQDMDISREPGAKYQVVFDHLVSPGEFYIQVLCPALSGMREMGKEIEAYFKNEKIPEQPYQAKGLKNKAKKELARRIVGRYGFCFTVDDPSWGRVEIKDWKPDEDNDFISVFFVDYGDTKAVPLSNLQPFVPRFKKYPKFAQRCHLTDIYPPDSAPGKPIPPWSTASVTMFEILLETMPNDFSCHIIVGESDGIYPKSSLPVNFFVNDGGVSTSVNDRMVEFEAAITLAEPPLPPDSNYSEPKKASAGVLDAATSQNLQIGEVLPVQVTCLLKMNRFYCVKECGDADEDFLAKLVSFMNKPENVKEMIGLKEPPNVGDLVVGKYADDDLWYRARVIKADPVSDRYKLLFLDYGNTEILTLKDLRKMEKKFLGFPFQLIECHLHGIEPSEEGSSEDAMKYLYSRVENGGLSVKICEVISEKNNTYEVELYNDDGEDIGENLIASKFAVKKKT